MKTEETAKSEKVLKDAKTLDHRKGVKNEEGLGEAESGKGQKASNKSAKKSRVSEIKYLFRSLANMIWPRRSAVTGNDYQQLPSRDSAT